MLKRRHFLSTGAGFLGAIVTSRLAISRQIPDGPNVEGLSGAIVFAYLRTIAKAEGTLPRPGIDPYRTQALSYRQIPEEYAFRDHPYWTDRIIPCATIGGQRVCSACTGAYQFHPDTFDGVQRQYKDRYWFNDGNFSPANQDLAAMYLLERIGVWNVLASKGGAIDRTLFLKASSLTAKEWASFPVYDGDTAGAYGQGARSIDSLYTYFQEQVQELSA